MIRLGAALWTAIVLALTGLAAAAVAQAGPPPPCSFRLSAPQVVHVSGIDMVTATIEVDECGWPAEPYSSVVCLQVDGDATTTSCMQAQGPGRAQVYSGPHRPGTTYAATGRGCSRWAGNPPAPDCQRLGPTTATL
ncbi:hypothetical protein [[Mycobacterium] wendilense]|uniref:Secreted protein n=1 Tax=[Mycobacterium] wendilense TaxID=3064284 RepID=A0ABM9MDH2_9MYCO|nr:hypothetical protein [Mycolicibacterium sp. MU0050]CAJ1582533.1 hypothetical protein MU0050_002147 [Mycolicibacterium sp. MU0050]